MELKAQFPPNATVYWCPEIRAARVTWDKLFCNLDQFIEICDYVIDLLKQHQANTWIVDTYESNGVFAKGVQEYIQQTLINRAIQNNITNVLTIVPQQKGLSSLSNKSWQKPVSNAGFVTGNFPDFETCRNWLLMQGNTRQVS